MPMMVTRRGDVMTISTVIRQSGWSVKSMFGKL
jgi:hypothetical protein